MEIKKLSKVLEEINLTLSELNKKNKDGKIRGQVLVDKIKDQEEFVFNRWGEQKVKKKIKSIVDEEGEEKSNQEIEPLLTVDGEYDPKKAEQVFKKRNYIEVIKSEDDKVYKLTDIEKTADFGSSGGASLGTKNTRLVESLQCIYLSLRQSKKSNLREEENPLDMIETEEGKWILQRVMIPDDLDFEDFSPFLSSWKNTFYRTANALYSVRTQLVQTKDRRSILDSNKTYNFHQIACKSNLIETIIKVYKSCEKEIPISKWTPSDIWVVNVEKEEEIISLLEGIEYIDDLNDFVNNLFDSKDLIGISLKKVNTSEEVLNLVINKETPKPIYILENILLTENPTKTINTSINAQRFSTIFGDGIEKLELRSFSGAEVLQDISAEVIGKDARQGRIGLKSINSILQKYGVEEIPYYADLLFNKGVDQLIDELSKLNYSILAKMNVETKREIGYTPSISTPRIISKYQGLLLAKRLLDNSEKTFDFMIIEDKRYPITKGDRILQDIFYYALSIENAKFVSPKYVRVI
jgi:predicted transcriptional regulator